MFLPCISLLLSKWNVSSFQRCSKRHWLCFRLIELQSARWTALRGMHVPYGQGVFRHPSYLTFWWILACAVLEVVFPMKVCEIIFCWICEAECLGHTYSLPRHLTQYRQEAGLHLEDRVSDLPHFPLYVSGATSDFYKGGRGNVNLHMRDTISEVVYSVTPFLMAGQSRATPTK